MFHSKSDCFSRDCLTIESVVVIMCATYCLRWKECILVSNVTVFEVVLTICITLNVAELCVCVCLSVCMSVREVH